MPQISQMTSAISHISYRDTSAGCIHVKSGQKQIFLLLLGGKSWFHCFLRAKFWHFSNLPFVQLSFTMQLLSRSILLSFCLWGVCSADQVYTLPRLVLQEARQQRSLSTLATGAKMGNSASAAHKTQTNFTGSKEKTLIFDVVEEAHMCCCTIFALIFL